MNPQQIYNNKVMFEEISKEKIIVEFKNNSLSAYGSELATLRLLKAWKEYPEIISCGYSKKLETFYFKMKIKK